MSDNKQSSCGSLLLPLSRRSALKTGAVGFLGIAAGGAAIRRAHASSEVKLGHIQPLTGQSSPWGIRANSGAQMAETEINEAGGFNDSKGNNYKLRIVTQDMASDATQAVTLFRQFATDPSVAAVMGPTNSIGFLPCVAVAAQSKTPLIGNGSGAPVKAWNDWTYRVNLVADVATPAFLKVIAQKIGLKRIAVIYDQTQDAQVADARFCQSLAREIGYQVVAYEACRGGDQDFSPQLTNIRSASPDAVYIAVSTGDGVRVVSQLREIGIKAPLLTGYGVLMDSVYWDGTNGGIAGGYTWIDQDLKAAGDRLKQWLESYKRRFPLEPTSYSVYGYDAVYTVVECIKQAGTTNREAIKDALKSLKYLGPLGTRITFENPPTGNNLTPTFTVMKVDGRSSGSPVL